MKIHIAEFELAIAQKYAGQNSSNKRVKREKRLIREEIYRAIGSNKVCPLPRSVVRNSFYHACWRLDRQQGYTGRNLYV